jgi:C-methyltransferase
MSVRSFVRMFGLPVFWTAAAAMDRSVTSGRPAADEADANGFWTYLRAHPDGARIFDDAMLAKAHAPIASVVDAFDSAPFGAIVDVGGGRGHLLRAVLDATPGGDFFADELPAGDAYLLMEVIH